MSQRSAVRCRVPACRAVLGWAGGGRLEVAAGVAVASLGPDGADIAVRLVCPACGAARDTEGWRLVVLRRLPPADAWQRAKGRVLS